MKIVTLEEHMVTPAMLEAWASSPAASEDHTSGFGEGVIGERLANVGDRRLRDMDDIGVDVQVLSLNSPGPQNLIAADAPGLAREANDAVADAIRSRPDRFEGFASLPTPDPDTLSHILSAHLLHYLLLSAHIRALLDGCVPSCV